MQYKKLYITKINNKNVKNVKTTYNVITITKRKA